MKADTESRATVPSAASASHSNWSLQDSAAAGSAGVTADAANVPPSGRPVRAGCALPTAATATTEAIASTANRPKPADHATACACSANTGSSTKG